MTVRVRLFAILKDKARRDGVELQLHAGATVEDAMRLLGDSEIELAPWLPKVATAVNREYAPRDRVLFDGDELALIPPVSGG